MKNIFFKRFIVFFLFVLPWTLVGCGGTNPTDTSNTYPGATFDPISGGIKGTVYGSGTSPLAGAYVETLEQQTTSDASGGYFLYPLSAGDYRVLARYSGYSPTYKEPVRVRSGEVTEQVDFLMESSSVATVSKDFEVLFLNPFYGTDGDEISVTAKGIGKTVGRVTIAGKDTSIMDWNSQNDGVIRVKLPAEVETGDVRLIINGETSHEVNPVRFIGRPIALEARPATGKPGAKVALLGRNFNQVISFNQVYLNDVKCDVFPDSTTKQLNILIPTGAQTGKFQVKNVNPGVYQLDGIASATFTIDPEVLYLVPARSVPGVTLTLYGKNFGNNKNVVKVHIGSSTPLIGNQILSFSPTKLTFSAPDNTVVPVGKTTQISLTIDGAQTASLTYSAYDSSLANLTTYGVYDFSAIAPGNTLRLARLSPNDRLAFVSTLSGDGTNPLDNTYAYVVTAYMGSQTVAIPAGIKTSLHPTNHRQAPPAVSDRYLDSGAFIREIARQQAQRPSLRTAKIFPMIDPAPASTTFWVVNMASPDPDNIDNDILATGTLLATGTYCFVYVDEAATGIGASESEQISTKFDEIYSLITTRFSNGTSVPPEGNIDAQNRVILFITPKINNGLSGALKSIGYFNPRDKNPAQNHSAGTEILYLDDQTFLTDLEHFRGAMAHELQHMIYYHQKSTEGVTWIDEGLSLLAQDIASCGYKQGLAIPGEMVGDYLRRPDLVSLNHWPIRSERSAKNWGMSYLFMEYLYEKCNTTQAIKALQTFRGGSVSGLSDITANVLPAPIGPGIGLADFFHRFAIAMYGDDLSSPLIDSAYRFDLISLRGGAAGVNGLGHVALDENPVQARSFPLLGFGCDVIEYTGGNDGDLEFTINSVPTAGTFKTWVIYLPK